MLIKALIISVILVAIVVLALGIKLWINPSAKYSGHKCALKNNKLDRDGACYKCHETDLSKCPEIDSNKPVQDKN